jgi:hypothetical protein
MGRRLVYLAAGVMVGWAILFAVVWSEARASFVAVALFVAAGGWWLGSRFPARPVSRWELGGAAVAVLVVGVLLAVLIPSTRVMCDCPGPPRGVSGVFTCNCQVDRHMAVRAALALGGFLLSLILGWAARGRTLSVERT